MPHPSDDVLRHARFARALRSPTNPSSSNTSAGLYSFPMCLPLERLAEFARPYIDEPWRRSELVSPVLLWDAPSVLVSSTQPDDNAPVGPLKAPAPNPTHTEPVVLRVGKGSGRMNPFATEVTIGRTFNNDVVVDDESVSRFHAYFSLNPRRGVWRIVDAESKNGTWIDGMRLPPLVAAEVRDRARVRVGDVDLRFLQPDTFFLYLDHLLGRRDWP